MCVKTHRLEHYKLYSSVQDSFVATEKQTGPVGLSAKAGHNSLHYFALFGLFRPRTLEELWVTIRELSNSEWEIKIRLPFAANYLQIQNQGQLHDNQNCIGCWKHEWSYNNILSIRHTVTFY